MSKTPEELAHYYADRLHKRIAHSDVFVEGFLAGYQAAAPRWISVKDRLPKINNRRSEDVLMLDEYGEMSVKPFKIVNNEIVVDWGEAGTRPLSDFTHWMPLPAAPKEEV
jgi:hypothetical protein